MCQMPVEQADVCNLMVVGMTAWLIIVTRVFLCEVPVPDDGGAVCEDCIVSVWVLCPSGCF